MSDLRQEGELVEDWLTRTARMALEPGEKLLRDLKPGARFTVESVTGTVQEHCRASTVVLVKSRKPPRVIKTQDGTKESRPIPQPDKLEHWSMDTPVTPTGEVVDLRKKAPTPGPEVPGERPEQGGSMATEAKTPRAKKAAEPKTKAYLVTRYETRKTDTEKGKKLLEATGQGGMIFQFVNKNQGSTFTAIFDHMKSQLKGKKADTVEANTRWYINDLLKGGFLKSVDDKVEATSAEEARTTEA